MSEHTGVAALVLAAGLSRRMGAFKLTLPWGGGTVIEQVLRAISEAGVQEVVVVLGHRAEEVKAALQAFSPRYVFNPEYENGEMLQSIRAGLCGLPEDCPAALLCLGDQPQIMPGTIAAVVREGERRGWGNVIIPSYAMRAGHPILLPRVLWEEVQRTPGTLRDVLRRHHEDVHYLLVDTPTILADLDTPEDYADQQPHPSEQP